MTTREEQIRAIAYRIWEEQGRPHGRHVEHWLQAEMRWLEANRPASAALPRPPARTALQARPPAPAADAKEDTKKRPHGATARDRSSKK